MVRGRGGISRLLYLERGVHTGFWRNGRVERAAMKEVAAHVSLAFYVSCPYCGAHSKFEAVLDEEGDGLRDRFREILATPGVGETRVLVYCVCCKTEYAITSFKL